MAKIDALSLEDPCSGSYRLYQTVHHLKKPA